MLRIQLFGHLTCMWEGQALKMGGLPRTLPLLAYLLLNRQAPIPRNRLAYTLWPDYIEADARANLRRHLHDLRRQLPTSSPTLPWILADATTIHWNPAALVWIDVEAFLAGTDPTAPHVGQTETAAGLYTGDLLVDLYDDWLFFEREQLRERCLAALAWLVHFHHTQQNLQQALQWAQQIVHMDPMREDMVRTIMQLRFEAGDRAGALQEYRRFEQRLRAEMDIPPMPETQALYDTMARQWVLTPTATNLDTTPTAPPQIDAGTALAGAPAPNGHAGEGRAQQDVEQATRDQKPPILSLSTSTTFTNLPAAVTAFIGRDLELYEVKHLLVNVQHPVRLLTLTGPAGCGKTRLALEFAQRFLTGPLDPFHDGIHVVWFSTITAHDQVLRTIAESFGIAEQYGQPLLQNLKLFFAGKRLLLILDNFEHLLPAGRQLVELLSAAPHLAILVTSRALLRVYGEHEYYVRPMRVPPRVDIDDTDAIARAEAVALFLARSRAINPAFVLSRDNAHDVATICIRLDGLPLAIELAAARTKLLPPSAILARLGNRLEFLTDRQQVHDSRHRTLRATLDWSYQLLAPDEQRLFVLLAIFPDSFTVEAAEAVGGACLGAGVFELLETLVDNSLLVSIDPDAGDTPRLRMLSTLHEYAWDRLARSDDLHRVGRAYAEYYATWVAATTPALRGPRQVEAHRLLLGEQANLRAALAWFADHAEVDHGLTMVCDLERYWSRSGYIFEGRDWLDRLLALSPPASAPIHRRGLLAAAQIYFWISDAYYPRTLDLCNQALYLCRAMGDTLGAARAQLILAETHNNLGQHAQALEHLHQSLAGYSASSDLLRRADALHSLALATLISGDTAAAEAMFAECEQVYRAHGDLWSVGFMLLVHSQGMYYHRHDFDRAIDLARQSLVMARQSSDTLIYGLALVNLADIALTQADYVVLESLASEALTIFRSIGELWQPPRLVRMLGHVDAHYGRITEAANAFRESLHLNHELGDRRGMGASLVALAKLAVAHGQLALGVRLLAGVRADLQREDLALLPADEATWQAVTRQAASQLSAEAFATNTREGADLALADLLRLAAQITFDMPG